MKRIMALAGLAVLSYSGVAHADPLTAGNKAYEKGDYIKAIEKWSKSNTPQALYNLGMVAEKGKIENCDTQCVATFYARSGDAGYVPAITALGRIYRSNGQEKEAAIILTLAARWYDSEARNLLLGMQIPIPEPDLFLAAAQQREAEAIAKQQELNDLLALSLAFGAVAWGAKQQGIANARSPVPVYQPPIPAPSSRPQTHLCPDGSYVGGSTCRMAPNGTYVSGRPALTPDGSYVGGKPRLAPNGKYVGGDAPLSLCPDGSYVSGRCTLTPNGSYVGTP